MILTLVASLFATSAIAADLPVVPRKAPIVAEYDYFNGLYLGAHGGVGWDRGAGDILGTLGFDTAPFGFVGGLHGGYNLRVGPNFLLGLEADGDIATMDGTVQNPGFIGSVNSKSRWLASVRGRFGFILVPNLLAYGTAGWGWAGSEFTLAAGTTQFSTSPTLNGAVAGGGLEYALNQNWGLRVEYLHYFLGDAHLNIAGGETIVPLAKATHNIGVARVGLSYHF